MVAPALVVIDPAFDVVAGVFDAATVMLAPLSADVVPPLLEATDETEELEEMAGL